MELLAKVPEAREKILVILRACATLSERSPRASFEGTMSVKIHIPTPLRPFVGNKDELELDSEGSVQELLQNLAQENEGLKKHLFNEEGEIRNFVNVYVNEEDIRYREGPRTVVKSGDVISIVPSIAGGACVCPFSRRA